MGVGVSVGGRSGVCVGSSVGAAVPVGDGSGVAVAVPVGSGVSVAVAVGVGVLVKVGVKVKTGAGVSTSPPGVGANCRAITFRRAGALLAAMPPTGSTRIIRFSIYCTL